MTRKTYRIRCYNATNDRYELLYERFTSRKKAEEIAQRLNELNQQHNASVVVEQ